MSVANKNSSAILKCDENAEEIVETGWECKPIAEEMAPFGFQISP